MAVTIPGVSRKHQEQSTDYMSNFDNLFQENWERVYQLLYRLVGDPDEAEDLALETFWRLYRTPPKQKDNLGGWLYRVALRIGYNALRSNKRRLNYELQAARLEPADSRVDLVEKVALSEQVGRVRKILKEMNQRSARLLLLRHSGFSYAEIGEILNIPVGSVGTYLSRAEKEFLRRFRPETKHS